MFCSSILFEKSHCAVQDIACLSLCQAYKLIQSQSIEAVLDKRLINDLIKSAQESQAVELQASSRAPCMMRKGNGSTMSMGMVD